MGVEALLNNRCVIGNWTAPALELYGAECQLSGVGAATCAAADGGI